MNDSVPPDRLLDQPFDRPLDRPLDQPLDQPLDRPLDRPLDDDERRDLISAWLDGRLDAAGAARLDADLRSSPAARDTLREWIELDVLLASAASRESFHEGDAAATTSQVAPVAARVGGGTAAPDRRAAFRRVAGWIAGLATLAATVAVGLWWRQTPTPAGNDNAAAGCAAVGRLVDAVFEPAVREPAIHQRARREPAVAAATLRQGESLGPGPIRLARGLVQLEFFSGATLWMEGAADVEIVSAWEARVRSGRVRAHVPPAARGFVVHAPGARLVDLGTSFGLNVSPDGSAAVRVFDGEVVVHPAGREGSTLGEGASLDVDGDGRALEGRDPASFLALDDVAAAVADHGRERRAAWSRWFEEARRDPRLVAMYRFDPPASPELGGLVNNVVEPARPEHDGAAVGVTWTAGRWPGSGAVAFRRAGGRVRTAIDGTHDVVSLSCWTRVDAVDRSYNSLFLTDGYDPGEPHWQIFADGSLMFSIAYPPTGERAGRHNQIYYSRPVFTVDTLGEWHHVAVSYDGVSGEVVQYFDGEPVGREVSPLHVAGRPIRFGPAEIGNWGLPTPGHRQPLRSLNGAIDEFAIYAAVLSAAEVKKIFEAGRVE